MPLVFCSFEWSKMCRTYGFIFVSLASLEEHFSTKAFEEFQRAKSEHIHKRFFSSPENEINV